MLTLHQLLAFGVVALVIIAIPGPSVVFTVGRALSYGRGIALTTVVGNSLGFLVVLTLVAIGLGDIVARSETAFAVVKYAGAGYLVWLGIQALRHRHGIEVNGETGPALPARAALRQGFMVGFTNPKGYVLFAAILPQFVDRDRGGPATVQMLALGLVAVTIGLLSDSVWALLASQLRRWFNASPARGRALGTVGGVSIIGLGLVLAVGGQPNR